MTLDAVGCRGISAVAAGCSGMSVDTAVMHGMMTINQVTRCRGRYVDAVLQSDARRDD